MMRKNNFKSTSNNKIDFIQMVTFASHIDRSLFML